MLRPRSHAATMSASATDADRIAKLQRRRLQMTLLSVANTLWQSSVIALYAWVGEVPWPVVYQFMAASVGCSALFAAVIKLGWNLRLRDQGLLMPQIVSFVVIQLVFLVLVPQLWILFVFAVFVTYNFAMMSFCPRQFNVAWVAVSLALGGALYAARGQLGNPVGSGLSIAVFWFFLVLCVRQLTAIGRQFSELRSQLSKKNEQLLESLERIRELADKDDLTGTWNRRSFMAALTEEAERASRTGTGFGFALLDIDLFKAVNDVHGHSVGDAVLKEFAAVASRQLRAPDRFARWGGEEFAVLLSSSTGMEESHVALERIRAAVQAHDWDRLAPGLRVTVSGGLALFGEGMRVQALIDDADHALYAAKAQGRNRICIGRGGMPPSAASGAMGQQAA